MERISRVRAGIFLAFFATLITAFALRLYSLQIIETGGQVDNHKTFTTITRVKAARGDILDCNGNVLVSNRASYDLVLNHFVILSAENTNEHLLQLVKLCQEQEIEYFDHFPVSKEAPFTYTLSAYNATWQGYFQKYLPTVGDGLDSDISAPLLMKKLRENYRIPSQWSDADARAVIGLRYELDLRRDITNLPTYVFVEDASSQALADILELNIPGMKTESSTVREYHTEYAAHILGYIGDMDKDEWAYYSSLEGQSYSMDAQVGKAGLELAFESYLHGTDGWRVDVVYADGTLKEQYYRKDANGNEQRPISGQNVELTIDLNLQRTAEDSMAELITNLRANEGADGSDVEGGAVVVMDTRTGQVLACASYPTYNLATYFDDYEMLEQAPYAPLFNRALQAAYPPGSTYKMSMVIAGIESGTISSGTFLEDKGHYDKYSPFTADCLRWSQSGRTHGYINAAQALRDSCNYFFYEIADQMKLSAMDEVAKGLGLGELTGIELGEKAGWRANAENKAILYANSTVAGATSWYPADQIMASIGQSINQFTPIQLCSYTSTLANRGVRYKATFLNRVISSDYQELVLENSSQVLSTMEISDDAYRAYTEGMRLVVTDGTAKSLFKDFPVEVAAKTGTAQHSGASDASDHGAFVCYAPYTEPEIAVVVYGEKAGHGSTMGQIAKEILSTYFGTEISGDGSSGENQIS